MSSDRNVSADLRLLTAETLQTLRPFDETLIVVSYLWLKHGYFFFMCNKKTSVMKLLSVLDYQPNSTFIRRVRNPQNRFHQVLWSTGPQLLVLSPDPSLDDLLDSVWFRPPVQVFVPWCISVKRTGFLSLLLDEFEMFFMSKSRNPSDVQQRRSRTLKKRLVWTKQTNQIWSPIPQTNIVSETWA